MRRKAREAVRSAAHIALERLESRTLFATWTPLAHTPPLGTGTMNLLTDGSVLMTDGGTGWQRLAPDSTGSYINGTWTRLAAAHDSRLYDATQVLQDGRVFVAGGEYGTGASTGEVYNPLTNSWLALPSQPYGKFLDSGSILLANGKVLISPVSPNPSGYTTIFDPATNTWSQGPKLFRGGSTDEQSFVKLDDDSILTIDGNTTSERYIPSLNQWINDAAVPVGLFDGLGEIGSAVRLADGRAFYIGGTSHTALYTPSGTTAPGTWVAGPDLPAGLGADDAPAAVLPDGRVLMALGPTGTYKGPTSLYVYDPTAGAIGAISVVSGAPSTGNAPFVMRMLSLPSGDVLFDDGGTLYDFNPGTAPLADAKPAINSLVANADGTMTLTGTGLNGINAGSAYGDDAQMDSNYPIVSFTNGSSVYYARTHGWSSTGVATGATPQSADFTLPLGIPAGTYSVFLVANGVASDAASVTISLTAGNAAPTIATVATATPSAVIGTSTALSVLGNDDAGEANLTYTWTTTTSPSLANLPSFSVNGTNAAKNVTATFSKIGAYTFKVTITDSGGLSISRTVSVNVTQAQTSIAVSPSLASLGGGGTQQFSATAYDQFGAAMAVQPSFTWAVTGGTGTINAAGLYTSLSTGTLATITATTGAFNSTAQVGVVSSPWSSQDIGSVGLPGTAYDNGSTFTIKSSGADIWGTSDEFHYISRAMNGDGMITARVATEQNTGPWAKVGVMIRNSRLPNDKYVLESVTPANGTAFQYRTSPAGSAGSTGGTGGLSAPYWVRLVRKGNVITGYRSSNGTTWVQDGTVNVTMGTTVYIGLEADSNNDGVLNTSTFDHVSVMAALNDPVSVSQGVATPVNVLANDTGPAGATLTVTAFGQGTKGSVVNSGNGVLAYTANANALGTDSFTYTISDGLGDTATATVNVTIVGLQAYYKLDDAFGTTAADASGNSQTANLTSTTWSTGVEGTGGLAFNGGSAFASVPALNLNSNTVTLSGWVKRNGSQSAFSGLIFTRTQGTTSGMHFGTTNELRYTWNNSASTYNWNSGLTVPDGVWTFVALVVTPTDATLYMQPQGSAMRSASNAIANTASSFEGATNIGQDPAGGRFFKGSMDEVRIYNAALSAPAIAALANLAPAVPGQAAATPSPVNGVSTALSVLGAGISGESALTYTWAATTLPSGAALPTFNINFNNAAKNAVATFSAAGNYTLTCTISDGILSTTSAVNVTVNQTLTSIAVTPSTSFAIMGGIIPFSASGVDQFGATMLAQPAFTWSVDGTGNTISSAGLFTAGPSADSFTITATSGAVTGTANADVLQPAIVTRGIFYNNSAFDGHDAGANTTTDGAATATDKSALLPGQISTLANFTNYDKGINGIWLDIANLPAAGVTAADFSFTAGTTADPSTWATAPAPTSVTLFRGAGAGGSDRIEIIWPDFSILNAWLRVTLNADANTGLASPDIFYFGNLAGDTANSTTSAAVTNTDMASVKFQLSPSAVPITSPYDFNRDGYVTLSDMGAVKFNLTHSLLFPFTAPPPPPAPAAHTLTAAASSAPKSTATRTLPQRLVAPTSTAPVSHNLTPPTNVIPIAPIVATRSRPFFSPLNDCCSMSDRWTLKLRCNDDPFSEGPVNQVFGRAHAIA